MYKKVFTSSKIKEIDLDDFKQMKRLDWKRLDQEEEEKIP